MYTVAKSRTKFKSNDVQVDVSRLQVNNKIDNIKEQEWISLSIESKNGDIWALRDAIIHLFGNCKYLWNALIKYDVDSIVLAFNNDKNLAGNEACKKAYKKLLKFFDREQLLIHLPSKNDFGEMTKGEITEWAKKIK